MSEFSAYVMYVNRPDLLKRSVESFVATWDELTVVDNSGFGIDTDLPDKVEIFTPPVPLTYAQSMNWMLANAIMRRRDFIIHFHSDAFSTNPTAVNELLVAVRGFRDENRKWACSYTFYDTLWAINPKALEAIGGWDTNLPTYFGDNDVRRRWELSGWDCIDTHIKGVNHEGSATINSDARLQFVNSITFPLSREYYKAKWGGEPGKERFTVPFGSALFLGAK